MTAAAVVACQYAPPHEFALNLPQTFARLRADSYAQYAWPRSLARLFRRNHMFVSLATSISTALVLLLTATLQPPAVLYGAQNTAGAFYRVIPKAVMMAVGGLTLASRCCVCRGLRMVGARPVCADLRPPSARHSASLARRIWAEADRMNDLDGVSQSAVFPKRLLYVCACRFHSTAALYEKFSDIALIRFSCCLAGTLAPRMLVGHGRYDHMVSSGTA